MTLILADCSTRENRAPTASLEEAGPAPHLASNIELIML